MTSSEVASSKTASSSSKAATSSAAASSKPAKPPKPSSSKPPVTNIEVPGFGGGSATYSGEIITSHEDGIAWGS